MAAQRIIASIEARMKSSRLPGKMLADAGGIPVIGLLVNRLRHASLLTDVVVATTTDPADDRLAVAAESYGVTVFRGSEDDVLNRVVGAQDRLSSDVVVEVCGDCPLLDPAIVDAAVARFVDGDVDVVTTTQPQSYPQGMDVQVFSLANLKWVDRNISDQAVREHVSLYFYENPDSYRIAGLMAPPNATRPDLRLQLDYAEDLAVIRSVHAALSPVHGDRYGLEHILSYLDANPAVAALNADCVERAAR